MKTLVARIFVVALVALGALSAGAATYVYNNSAPASDMTNRLGAANNIWFGDEVVLDGAAYAANQYMTHFDFQYWAESTSGLTIDVELRLNDGPFYDGSNPPREPGTLIYSYYNLALGNTSRSTINFDLADFPGGNPIYLPGNTLTLCVRFDFNGGGGTAGIDLYNPPVVGSSFLDYWVDTGAGWQLSTNNVFGTVNFGMRIEAVPEPTAFSLFALGGLTALAVRRILRRK
jgi:hypothetical protein